MPENTSKKIQKIWTGGKNPNAPVECPNILCEVKALMELIKEEGVAELTTTEERKVNMRKSVTLEHCFGGEETTGRRKTPRWILCSFKERRRN